MRRGNGIAVFFGMLLALSSAVRADDLSEAKRFLCTGHLVARCTPDQECVTGPPYILNLPPFIVVDLAAKTLGTPSSAEEQRVSQIARIQRSNGLILLQGDDNGRAYSWTIVEESGSLTASVSDADEGIVVFGACTPYSGR